MLGGMTPEKRVLPRVRTDATAASLKRGERLAAEAAKADKEIERVTRRLLRKRDQLWDEASRLGIPRHRLATIAGRSQGAVDHGITRARARAEVVRD